MGATVDVVSNSISILGEGPLWCAVDRSLLWVDIKGHKLHRLRNGKNENWTTAYPLSCIVLRADGGLMGALGTTIARLSAHQDAGLRIETFAELQLAEGVRCNDGKIAPDGTFWLSTMDDGEVAALGAWWRVHPDGCINQVGPADVRVANGPAFDPIRQRTFLSDSALQTTYTLDGWDDNAYATRRVLRTFGEGEGYPDGMTVDADGRLWVAFWDGRCVRAIDPITGATLNQIDLPVRRPTSCTFGGENLDVLYVTSASIGLSEATSLDGALLAVEGLGVRGLDAGRFGSAKP